MKKWTTLCLLVLLSACTRIESTATTEPTEPPTAVAQATATERPTDPPPATATVGPGLQVPDDTPAPTGTEPPEATATEAPAEPDLSFLEVRPGDWTRGPSDATVTIVEYSDFQ